MGHLHHLVLELLLQQAATNGLHLVVHYDLMKGEEGRGEKGLKYENDEVRVAVRFQNTPKKEHKSHCENSTIISSYTRSYLVNGMIPSQSRHIMLRKGHLPQRLSLVKHGLMLNCQRYSRLRSKSKDSQWDGQSGHCGLFEVIGEI
jgi:hypothetical protein